jgi:hypothetical protein
MVFFNYATMQMAAKIVYYGPGLCGKTTNLQHIYQKTSPKSRGEMVSLETETDRTLFFDLLPLDVGNIAGFKTRFQLYTVPGQVFYNSTRKLVLRGVDGVVFIADSQVPMMEANIESLHNLKENLEELGLSMEEVPVVLQYNKRDLKNVVSVEEMNRVLNPRNGPWFEASAVQGTGVFETLKGISKATLITLRKKALGEEKPRIPEVATKPIPEKPKQMTPPPAPQAPVPEALSGPAAPSEPPRPAPAAAAPTPATKPGVAPTPAAVAAAAPAPAAPMAPPRAATPAPKPVMPTAAEIAKETVEFSQVAILATKPALKKIAVKTSDIALKLDALRDMYTGKPTKDKKADAMLDTLSGLLDVGRSSREKRFTKKLKIRLEPSEIDLVKNLSVDFHLLGDNNLHKRFSNAMSISVEGKTNPKKLILEIRLEILKK